MTTITIPLTQGYVALIDAADLPSKECAACNVVKPLSEFHRLAGGKHGRYPRCKDCKNSEGRAYKDKHRGEINARARILRNNPVATCGSPVKIGDRFCRVLVIAQVESRNCKRRWKCICDCGTVWVCLGSSLASGGTKSCGCWNRDRQNNFGRPQCKTHPAECTSWEKMIARCYNPNQHGYAHYGGRGITVCDRWRESFADFVDDMGLRPSLRHSIDRINNNGNYEPGNCRWGTQSEQHDNRRNTKFLTAFGRTQSIRAWSAETGISQLTIRSRCLRGWDPESALTLSLAKGVPLWRRSEDRAVPPNAIQCALDALAAAGEPAVYAGERYRLAGQEEAR